MPDRRWTLSAESITAAAAVVAALIALAVGVWENVQEREHNRLSVLPHVNFIIELHRSDHPDSTDRALVRLVNEGVGPAIVDDLQIRLTEAEDTARDHRGWDQVREAIASWGARVESRAEVGEGTVLGVGREYSLLRLEVPDQPPGAPHPFDRILDQLGIVVAYRSIYGDQFRATFGEEEPI